MGISEYILVVDISYKISLKLSVRLSISHFLCVFLVLKKLKLIFNLSYCSVFVLSLSSNLLFTRNRSSVHMLYQTTLCNKTLNSSCEISLSSRLCCDAIRYSKISFARFSF